MNESDPPAVCFREEGVRETNSLRCFLTCAVAVVEEEADARRMSLLPPRARSTALIACMRREGGGEREEGAISNDEGRV